ncbi:uncharacterized protein LOC105665024 isoform X2 [Ceratitis capitata]|uniref:uncharacterized protein LOC105665024 isoform X2 n=1 Tax=Ceratitis capitata TaxID=7213 RepID=UPI000A10C8EF|nr:uncharacterized protein LOC105665024 isoform X2 [Ceratitis capitata]
MDLLPSKSRVKDKRERQPNWTEAEKQLLLSLTRVHQMILENKGSDTMTIKRKSEAWDDITSNMQAAGYQRSKERLKQQLGRIRAAEAKKAKDELAKNLFQNKQLIISLSTSEQMASPTIVMPPPIQDVAIKVEKDISLEELSPSTTFQQISKGQHEKYGIADYYPSPSPVNQNVNKQVSQELQVQSLKPFVTDNESSVSDHQLPTFPTNFGSHCMCNCNRKKLRNIRLRINGHSPRNRSQRAHQLHLYRVAVEKERLKMLKLQQKRDRIFYQKDKEIQNLKLQILGNLAVNRIHHINFT